MPIDLKTELGPIDPDDPKYAAMLTNLQGNILKGHGREHTVQVFFELDVKNRGWLVRQRLAAVAGRYVTSALQQHVETQHYKRFKIPGGLFGNLFITARGFRSLGFSEEQIKTAFDERAGDFGVRSNFREGMAAHGDELNDPPPSAWEEGYREGRIDAMFLLADDDEGHLLRRGRDLITELDQFSTILAVERGHALRTGEGEGIEHFGYVDGRSQPIFFKNDLAGEGPTNKWDPSAPPGLVLVPDRNAAAPDCFGSYFVFRKLEQDVLRFTVAEHTLADELGLVGQDRERAGAMAVGRFRDGTPLALSQTDGFIPSKENNFKYDADPDGTKCPFHAHIRKVNPRGDIGRRVDPAATEDVAERPRRIARRGITYGSRNRHPNAFQALDDLPSKEVGLLFMCFQASIANQFAFIQKLWSNNTDFVAAGTGVDPLIGREATAGGGPPVAQSWPLQWGRKERAEIAFGSFVTLKGGEFFFAPSLPFLKVLSPPT